MGLFGGICKVVAGVAAGAAAVAAAPVVIATGAAAAAAAGVAAATAGAAVTGAAGAVASTVAAAGTGVAGAIGTATSAVGAATTGAVSTLGSAVTGAVTTSTGAITGAVSSTSGTVAQTTGTVLKTAGVITKTKTIGGAVQLAGNTAIDIASQTVKVVGKVALENGNLIDKAAVEAAKSVAGTPGGQIVNKIATAGTEISKNIGNVTGNVAKENASRIMTASNATKVGEATNVYVEGKTKLELSKNTTGKIKEELDKS